MYQIINKEDIFRSIINNRDVFIVMPNEEKCVWANPLTVNDIMNMVNGEALIIEKQNAKPDNREVSRRFIDTVKFTEMLHAKNIRQTELARLSGVTTWTINSYVYHKNKPRTSTLKKICEILKCDPEEILEG